VTIMSEQERRASGFTDQLNELLMDKNLHYVMSIDPTDFSSQYRVFLKECISEPEDLAGKKIRASAAYVPMLDHFKAEAINVNTSEIYTAVERGLVEGFVFPIDGVLKYKLEEVVNYYVDPGFGSQDFAFIMNYGVWNSIPDDLQKLIMDEVNAFEKDWEKEKYNQQVNNEWPSRIEAAGIEKCSLSAEGGQRLQDAYYSALWDDIVEKSPNYGAKLRTIVGQ